LAKTKIQVEVEALSTGFDALQHKIDELFKLQKDIKIGVDTTALQTSLTNVKGVFDTLIQRVQTFQTTSKNAFSQVFSKANIQQFSSGLHQIGKQFTQATFSGTPGGADFFKKLTTQAGTIVEARQGVLEVNRWIEANKKLADPALLQWASRYRNSLELVAHGMEKGRASIRNFSLSMRLLKTEIKDLIFWQARWYATKAIIFTPLQIGTEVITSFVQWQQAMQNAAAVSTYTKKELEALKQTTLDIGKQTPISAKEASKALLEFAQAGLDAATAQKLLPLASKMVVATQEDMKVAVSALTTAFYAWKLEAKDMPAVADQIAASMADSKLKVEDLGTIFNYLGTMAKQAGMSVSDTLTLVTVMSKAGVKPSTIGTGLTQALVALTKMAPKLRAELAKLKLDWKEFQIPQNNPLEVLKKLASSGIDLTGIFKGFETRAGRSIAAVVNQGLQMIDETNAKIKEKGFLDKAFETSMNAIENQAKRFKNIMEAEIFDILDGAGTVFASFLKMVNDTITGVNGLNDAVRFLNATITTLALVSFGKWIASITPLLALLTKLRAFVVSVILILANPASIGAIAINPWLALAVAIGVVVTALLKLKDIFTEVKKVMAENTGEDVLRSMSPFALKQRYKMIGDLVDRMEKTKAAGLPTDVQPGELSAVGMSGDVLIKGQTRALEDLKTYQRKFYSQLMVLGEKGPAHPIEPPVKTIPEVEKPMKGLSLASAWGLDKKAADEAKKMLEDGLKTSLAIIEQGHKLGMVSDEEFQKARLQLEISTIDGMLEQEQKLGESLQKGDVYQRYLAARAKLSQDPRSEQQIADLDKRFENEKAEWIRRTEDLNTRKLLATISAETEITKAQLDEANRRKDLDLKLVDEAEQAKLQLKQQYISDEKELNKWKYDQQLISATDYYAKEQALIEQDLQAQLEANEASKQAAYDRLALVVQTTGEFSNASKQAYVDLVFTLAKLEDEKVMLVAKSASARVNIEREAVNNIKKIYEDAFKDGGMLSGVIAVTQKTMDTLSKANLDIATNVASAVESISSAMETAFMDFFDHTSEGFLNWRNLVTSILNEIIKELIKVFIVKQLIGGIQGVVGGWFSGGRELNATDTNLMNFMVPEGRASGGPVSLNRAYYVGERGPEIFVPNTNGTIVPNGATQPIINVYNNNGSNISTNTKKTNQGMEIDVLIDNAVAKKLGQFGSSTNKTMRNNFGTQPVLVNR